MLIFKRLSLVIAVFIMVCMLMVGCSKSDIPVNPADKDSTHTPNDDSEKEDFLSPNDDKRQNDLHSWAGAYGFSEYAPPDIYVVSKMIDYEEQYRDA